MASNISVIGPSRVSKTLIIFFRILGLWYYPDTTVAYKFYAFTLHFIFSFLYVICYVVNLFFLTNLSEATHSLYITLTVVALFVKTINFYWYNSRIQANLVKIQQFQLNDDDEIELVGRRMKMFMKLMLYYYGVANTTGLTTYINALFATPTQLPFYAWYPVDWKHNSRDYWIAYSYQTIGMIMEVNLNITIESFPCFVMFMISVQMELLGRRLENMKFIETKCNKLNDVGDMTERKNYVIGQRRNRDLDGNNNKNLETSLVECIKLHQNLIK